MSIDRKEAGEMQGANLSAIGAFCAARAEKLRDALCDEGLDHEASNFIRGQIRVFRQLAGIKTHVETALK